MLSGCSANWHIQRAQKKGALIETDSIKGKLFIDGKKGLAQGKSDLADLFSKPIPLVTNWKPDPKTGKQFPPTTTEARIIHDTVTNEIIIYVPIECPPDSVEYTTEINTNVDCPPRKGVKQFWVVVYVIGGMLVGFVLGVITKKILG